MTTRVDARIVEALAHNAREQAEHGPGLRYSTRAATAAKCPSGRHILRVGLGVMGVGCMWFEATEGDKSDPLWDELPVERCSPALCEFGPGGSLDACEPPETKS